MGRSRIVGLVLVVASVAALVMSAYSSYRLRTYAACQSAVTEQLIRVQNARADAAAQDRQTDRDESSATATLIIAVFSLQSGQERVAAYGEYRTTLDALTARRAATEQQRKANPLPAPPSQVCG